MKYSEKMALLMKGVKFDEIKALEEQEAAEKTEEATKKAEEEKKSKDEKKEQSALEVAHSMIKDLETKLEAKDGEIAKLNEQFAKINNRQTVIDDPVHQLDATDVMSELFNKKKED